MTHTRPASPRGRAVWRVLLRKELRDALSNSWLIGYGVVLGALGLASIAAGMDAVTGLGLDNVGRTTATLMNLCLLLAPLLAVLMGAASIAAEAERGTLDHLLAQPVSRAEVLLVKHAALLIALSAATLAGFAPAAAFVLHAAGPSSIGVLLLFPALAIAAASAMAAIGLFISVSSRSSAQAQGTAVLVWFVMALLYDLVLIGVLAGTHMPPPVLAATLALNPIDAARVLGVLALEPDLYLLGPAGAYLSSVWGSAGAAAFLTTSLAFWSAAPVVAALARFRITGPRRVRGARPLSSHAVAATEGGPEGPPLRGQTPARKVNTSTCVQIVKEEKPCGMFLE